MGDECPVHGNSKFWIFCPGKRERSARYTLPGSIAMQRLVSPDLKVYTISDLEALSELVAGLRLDSTLASMQQPPTVAGLPDGWQWCPSRAPDGRELGAAT